MTIETNTEIPQVAPVQEAPLAEASAVVAPAVETPVEATPVETPAVESVTPPAVEAPVEEAPKTETTLLGEETKNETAEVIEAPKEGETVAEEVKQEDEGGQTDEPAPPPKYDPFELPEGITLSEDRIGKFTELLGELELGGKVPHELVQQFGQKAVEFHINEVKQAVSDLTKAYQESWSNQVVEWKNQFLADPEIGGNRFQTTVDAARTFIKTHGGTPEQQAEFRSLMESSGLGNHPAMIRLLANAGASMEEGRPLAATKPVSAPKSKTATMYGRSQ